MRRWTALAAIAAVLVLGGCSVAGGAASDGTVAIPAPAEADGSADTADPGAADSDSSRSVVAQGSLVVTVADPIAAASDAAAIVESVGGRIDRRSAQPGGDDATTASAALTVRIPSEQLTSTVDELTALGELEDYQLTEDDVTDQTRDLDARISALRASTARLSALLATAASTADLLEIETTLSQRQSDLEALDSQARSLADQVDLATVTVSFGSESTAPVDRPADFFSGVVIGWEALVAFTGSVLVGVGVTLPWLILPAIAAVVVPLAIRVRRRRTVAAAATMEQ